MKYNTQNAKIKSITEKTLIVGIDVEVKRTLQEHSIGVITSIQRNRWNSVIQKLDL